MASAPALSKWENAIVRRGNAQLVSTAWKKAQDLRKKTAAATRGLFQEMVTVGVDVAGPPQLGRFTPTWEELSLSWAERKGHEHFYYATGQLERNLIAKNPQTVFGAPEVFLDFDGKSIKVTAGAPPRRIANSYITGLKIRVIPFPKLKDPWRAERLVFREGSKSFFKLVNPNGHYLRPLVSPFLQWYLQVKLKRLIR